MTVQQCVYVYVCVSEQILQTNLLQIYVNI